ncbi:MAG: 2-hydroxyacyl-CoA dehydratase [Chitinivibrionales bacterium]|nr:2-hydroxyacyl-CoA dehydratase [Chitinivibrionales bacterium]MBD3356450.1 2-hydroxyacyl-CoA dehydratase [Chitinivibrionales bacterium]
MSDATFDYRPLWTDLELNLEDHDALLEVLSKTYGDIFMSQKNRPEGMTYFDFVMSEIHGLRIKELMDAKGNGHKVIGTYCTFVPEELVLAVDGIMVGLCAGADFAVDEVERLLPRNTCALIKSTLGFKLGRVCPYLEACDMVIGENTCDGKKKAYEILDRLIPNFYAMDMPQMKSSEGKALLRAEYLKLKEQLEELSGKKITPETLKKAIETVNGKRRAVQRLARLRAADPAPISGLDSLLVNQVFFYDNPERFTDSVNNICDEIEERVGADEGVKPKGTTRLLMSGCPMAVPNWKIPAVVEGLNAIIVGEESCIGERGSRGCVDESAEGMEGMVDAIVERYCEIDCAIFTPNTERLMHIKNMVKKYRVDGVVLYGLNFCSPYLIEALDVEKELEKGGIPAIRIETDYSQEDTGQIKTRIEAFIERLSD